MDLTKMNNKLLETKSMHDIMYLHSSNSCTYRKLEGGCYGIKKRKEMHTLCQSFN